MTTFVSGPMFEGSTSGPWTSSLHKSGAHYNIYGCRDENGMAALREFFPDGQANAMNVALFSTSGVHGMYTTIEEAEAAMLRGHKDEDGEDTVPSVTFLIVQPRIVCNRYGNCLPKTADDIAFLKTLRASSWKALLTIGASEAL